MVSIWLNIILGNILSQLQRVVFWRLRIPTWPIIFYSILLAISKILFYRVFLRELVVAVQFGAVFGVSAAVGTLILWNFTACSSFLLRYWDGDSVDRYDIVCISDVHSRLVGFYLGKPEGAFLLRSSLPQWVICSFFGVSLFNYGWLADIILAFRTKN